MNDAFKMKQAVFNAQDLYKMLRLSMINYFPYDTATIQSDEILTIFLQKEHGLDIEIANIQEERGLIFSGNSYYIYKDLDKEEKGPYHSSAWYVMQVAKWHKQELGLLNQDLDAMRQWLKSNDYVKGNLPTDKFLKEENLIIADSHAK
ncbi:TPA: hypothetical protein ACGAHT_004598 [Salmonella enterica subsp. enterica serovar Newport]